MDMKKIFCAALLFVLTFWTVPSQAQFKFGVKGGLNITSVHLNSDLLKVDNVTGFQIGPMIEATVPLVGFGVDAALLFSQKGADVHSAVNEKSFKASYLDVPVNLKWKFGIPIAKVYVAAGPYVGFRVGGDKIWNVLGEQIEAESFSAGLNFGGGVELIKFLQIGINYGLGLTDNFSADKFDIKAKNRGWSVTAAVLF